MFNFTNGKDISTAKLGYVSNPRYTVCCCNSYGPTMGNLHCNNNAWTYFDGVDYPRLVIPKNIIAIENYEVFQVIKKEN